MSETRALYDEIGRGYDESRRADPHLADRLTHLLGASEGDWVLDVACGTGNYTYALKSRSVNIMGIDLSARMLGTAKSKGLSGLLALGDVEALPYVDGAFASAICTLATHHFSNLERAFSEVYRVLDGNRLVIFTSTPEQMRGYWLNEYFPVALRDSIEQMPGLDETQAALKSTGFGLIESEIYEVKPDLSDHFLYSAKHEPERYLDEGFRSGISTFSSLANAKEVRLGCELLQRDIETKRVADVIESYRHSAGDYLFVVAHKERGSLKMC